MQSVFRGTSQEFNCFLTFHLLLSQAAAVFSEALLGQNCHGAHCRLPTHTQSGYATRRDRGGNAITNTIQDAQKSLQEDKACVTEHFSSHPLEKHLECKLAAQFSCRTRQELRGIFPHSTAVTKTTAPHQEGRGCAT